jgi:hypothetical protein
MAPYTTLHLHSGPHGGAATARRTHDLRKVSGGLSVRSQ